MDSIFHLNAFGDLKIESKGGFINYGGGGLRRNRGGAKKEIKVSLGGGEKKIKVC